MHTWPGPPTAELGMSDAIKAMSTFLKQHPIPVEHHERTVANYQHLCPHALEQKAMKPKIRPPASVPPPQPAPQPQRQAFVIKERPAPASGRITGLNLSDPAVVERLADTGWRRL